MGPGLGAEHIVLHPRFVTAWRGGLYYEGLPALQRLPGAVVGLEESKTEKYLGATAGFGIFFRRHLLDFSLDYRIGENVGAGRYTAVTDTVDYTEIDSRVNYTFHF